VKISKENIGNITIAIQTLEGSFEILNEETATGRATQLTGVGDKMENLYGKLKVMLREIATDLGSEFKNIQANSRPKSVEMEFQIGLSAEVGPVWLLGAKGNYAMKVKMTWDLEKNV
jgi:hypothetical protein